MKVDKITLEDLVGRIGQFYLGRAIIPSAKWYGDRELRLYLASFSKDEWILKACVYGDDGSHYWLRGEWMWQSDERRYVFGGCTRFPNKEKAIEEINMMLQTGIIKELNIQD